MKCPMHGTARSHAGLRNRRTPPRRGVALMDVIIGSVMLAIGLSVVISLSSRSLASQTDGEKRVVAGWLADELLNMVLVEGPIDYPRMYDTDGYFDEPFEDFRYDVSIEYRGVFAPHRVTARVSWPSGNGWQDLAVQTMIMDRDDRELFLPREPLEPIDRERRYLERIHGEEEAELMQ